MYFHFFCSTSYTAVKPVQQFNDNSHSTPLIIIFFLLRNQYFPCWWCGKEKSFSLLLNYFIYFVFSLPFLSSFQKLYLNALLFRLDISEMSRQIISIIINIHLHCSWIPYGKKMSCKSYIFYNSRPHRTNFVVKWKIQCFIIITFPFHNCSKSTKCE